MPDQNWTHDALDQIFALVSSGIKSGSDRRTRPNGQDWKVRFRADPSSTGSDELTIKFIRRD